MAAKLYNLIIILT